MTVGRLAGWGLRVPRGRRPASLLLAPMARRPFPSLTHTARRCLSQGPNPTHTGILKGTDSPALRQTGSSADLCAGIYHGRFSVNYRHETDAAEEGLGSRRLR